MLYLCPLYRVNRKKGDPAAAYLGSQMDLLQELEESRTTYADGTDCIQTTTNQCYTLPQCFAG